MGRLFEGWWSIFIRLEGRKVCVCREALWGHVSIDTDLQPALLAKLESTRSAPEKGRFVFQFKLKS